MILKLKYPPIPENASKLAEICVEAASRISGLSLDYSVSSLSAVDKLLEKFRSEGLNAEDIPETLFCYGCYVGAVLIRQLGGRWVRLEESPLAAYGGPPIVVLLDSGSAWNPIDRVFYRVDAGREFDLSYFFKTAESQATRSRPPNGQR